jgi:hypothetical protein
MVLIDAQSRLFSSGLAADIGAVFVEAAVFLASGFLGSGFLGSGDLGAGVGLLLSVTIDPLILNQWLRLA